ncbi:MAG TPA: DNA/RNA non-specific endonuclease [Povalibacter sp.]
MSGDVGPISTHSPYAWNSCLPPSEQQMLVLRYLRDDKLDAHGLVRELQQQIKQLPTASDTWIDGVLAQLTPEQRRVVADTFVDAAGPAGVARIAATVEGQRALASLYAEASPLVQQALQQQQLQLPMCPRVDFAQLHASAAPTAAAPAADTSAQERDLMLDLGQIGLSIAGVIDPTPVSDGIDGAISVGRGDWLGAGISVVSMIPYVGDLAKIGKLGKLLETVDTAVDLAKASPAFARAVKPVLQTIRDALHAAPLDSLPSVVREPLQKMASKIDELLNAGQVAASGTRVAATVGRNTVTWTLDAAGRPAAAEATLKEAFTSASRSGAERTAQTTAGNAGVADDVGGHILGHRFVLDQGGRNLFPQNVQFNNSAYRTMENEWASWIQQGKEVRVNLQLDMPTGQVRPDRIEVSYEVIDPASGKVVYDNSTVFQNQAGQTFDRVPTVQMPHY